MRKAPTVIIVILNLESVTKDRRNQGMRAKRVADVSRRDLKGRGSAHPAVPAAYTPSPAASQAPPRTT